jgi:hypothetical protein
MDMDMYSPNNKRHFLDVRRQKWHYDRVAEMQIIEKKQM